MTSQNNIHPKNNNQEVTVDIIKIQSDSHKHNYNFLKSVNWIIINMTISLQQIYKYKTDDKIDVEM